MSVIDPAFSPESGGPARMPFFQHFEHIARSIEVVS
jgi:hypothetical protein